MNNDYDIIINNYVDKHYYMVIGDIQFNGNKIDSDSFIIKSKLNESDYYKGSFLKEVNLIFGDVEDEKSPTNKIILEWYANESTKLASNTLNKIKKIENYFKDNIKLRLGARNWETIKKDGSIFLMKDAIDELDKLGIHWLNTKIVRHFYDLWYKEEIIITSEKLMNFN